MMERVGGGEAVAGAGAVDVERAMMVWLGV